MQSAYTADVIGVVDGIETPAGRFLDNLDLSLDGDLERQFGWRGARVHFSLLANGGGEPNAIAGTLQGYDNIEVGSPGVRLYEAWIEQDLADGAGSVLAGLYDVNSEFYATEASDLLIAPPFGIGSELAATGPNGPAIFPSTSLAVRVRIGSREGLHVQAAAVNARAGTIGDDGGVDTTMDDGILYLAEAGWTGPVRIAVGAWRYGEGQEDIRDVLPGGDPALSDAQGAYLVAEGTVFEAEDAPTVRAFVRLGVSDGDTTDFNGGWQTGLRVDSVFEGRPDSAFSIGFHQGLLSDKAQANARDGGVTFGEAEGGIELTYADTFGPFTIQPDLQWIYNPGGDEDRDPILTAGLRVILTLR
ncbi:carbohydrate porin [Brevundimonas sp.]|uniref:carbohydrate porin n=1 Tax=Brevundimonas sp. TaxID=1871086 RepID=UPI00261C432F|nr:carbohydrate porin [Brevundimonas sp.]